MNNNEFTLYFFSGFCGIYALASIVFLWISRLTKRRDFKNYLGLSLSVFSYGVIGIMFLKGFTSDFKANFLFPAGCFAAGSAFYHYFLALKSRFYLKGRYVSYVNLFIVFIMVPPILAMIGYPFGEYLFFTDGGQAYSNEFMATSMGLWRPTDEANLFLGFVSLNFVVANAYLLYRLAPMKLSGFHKLIYFGIFSSFLANLNDNLMGLDILHWTFPMLFVGYICELVYFLIISLRAYSVEVRDSQTFSELESNWKGLILRNRQPENTKAASIGPGSVRKAALYTVQNLKQTFPRLNVSVEANIDSSAVMERQEHELAVLFYHILWEIFQNIQNSPSLRGHISINGFDENRMILTFTDDSPRNYTEANQPKPRLSFSNLKRLVDGFNAEIFLEEGELKNVYHLKL